MAKFDYLKLCTYTIKPEIDITVNYWTALFPHNWKDILFPLQPRSRNGYVSLPIQSLNNLIQTYTEVIYINSVGQNFYSLPWLYCHNPIDINNILLALVSDWILGAFNKASEEAKANAIAALRASNLVWTQQTFKLSQWNKENNGTAKYSDAAFFIFPDYLVNKLTGKTLQIKTRDGDKKLAVYRTIKPTANGSELISEPLEYTYTTAKTQKKSTYLYSIVISFYIQTFAWEDYPVINCDFGVRIWLSSKSILKKDYNSSVYLKINLPWIKDSENRQNTSFTVTKINTYSETINVNNEEKTVWHNRWIFRLSSTLQQTGLIQLPENAEDVVNDPLNFKEQLLIVFKNGIKPNSKINPGLTPGDRKFLLNSISQELTELELFSRIERVGYKISKNTNNPILDLLEVINDLEKEKNKAPETIEKLTKKKQELQKEVVKLIKTRLGKQNIQVHIWYQEETTRERIITYLYEFIDSSIVEIESEYLGELRTPLPIERRNQAIEAIQQRAEELADQIEATKKPGIAYIELQGADSFNPSYKDVKPALRWGHARLGWKSQFLVPEAEASNVEHRTKSAILDGLRQLLLLPPTSDLTFIDDKSKEEYNFNNFHYVALWVIQRNKTNNKNLNRKTEYLPIFIYTPAKLTLASDVKIFAPGLDKWCSYQDIFEALATGEAHGYENTDDVKGSDKVSNFISTTIANQILPLGKNNNLIFFAHRQNSRRFWSYLTNKNIVRDEIQLNQTDTPIKMKEYPGLRIIGLRDRYQSETPQYFAENKEGYTIGYSKGLWQVTDRIFYSTDNTSKTQRFNRHLSKLTSWVNDNNTTKSPSPTTNTPMPNILEITVACCQSEDKPWALAALTHEMRYDCINYDGALSLPAIIHLMKQIEEYSVLNERL
ncbi:MAG: DUF3962 domain-containing protein [Xenococcaceae cyanobacterium MO_207.B15]|nr:DUF3962 domain-containing protein [Xenococcaceae cyanobacterium MO_207.B15]